MNARAEEAPLSEAERKAWRAAYRMAEAEPGKPVSVWKSNGEWIVLKNGQEAPTRARLQGTITGPLNYTMRYSVHHPDGRVTFHEMERKS